MLKRFIPFYNKQRMYQLRSCLIKHLKLIFIKRYFVSKYAYKFMKYHKSTLSLEPKTVPHFQISWVHYKNSFHFLTLPNKLASKIDLIKGILYPNMPYYVFEA